MGVISFKAVLPSPPSQPSPIKGEGADEAANVPEMPEHIPLPARKVGKAGMGGERSKSRTREAGAGRLKTNYPFSAPCRSNIRASSATPSDTVSAVG